MQRHLLLVALAIGVPAASAADVYKWTDPAGVVHYTDTEPSQDTKAERMHVAGMGKPAAAASDIAGVDAPPAGKAAAAPAQASTVAATGAEPNAQARCDQARKTLEILQGVTPVAFDTGGKGPPQPLDDATRQTQIAHAQATIARYCK